MQTPPQIRVINRKGGDKKSYRLDQDQVQIGRGHANYIVLEGANVSRSHAEILCEGTNLFIRDLKSDNGTFLNDKRLQPEEKTLLRSDDLIRVGDFDLRLRLAKSGESPDIYEITDTDILEIKMVKRLLKAMDRDNTPSLEVMEGPLSGRRLVLEGKNQTVAIGRNPSCEFFIDSDVLSRRHARIEKRFEEIVLHDLKSKNGTFVNRKRIAETPLHDGDIIHLGTLTLVFRNPQEISFDLEPPKLAPEREKISPPETEKPEGAESRASLETPAEAVEEPARFPLSPIELAAILIGLMILIGSIWGIIKILK